MRQAVPRQWTGEFGTRSSKLAAAAALFVLGMCAVPLPGQIRQISICAPNANGVPQNGPNYTCKPGADTEQTVVAPDGQSTINQYAGGGITDEHSSVLPPGSVSLADGRKNKDYLFFVASNAKDVTEAQPGPDIGALVLSGAGPTTPNGDPAWDANFRWTMDYASADGYGTYCDSTGKNCTQGTVFLPPIFQGNCPLAAGPSPSNAMSGVFGPRDKASPPFSLTNSPLPPDTTFDLSYAAPGSVVRDPTGVDGSMLMIYEGVNICDPSGKVTSIGLATSDDYGRTWPTYRGAPYCNSASGPFCDAFQFYSMPYNNPYQGPRQAEGTSGPGLCHGNDCSTTPPYSYGRYAILRAGGSEPSAFVDSANPNNSWPPYVYVVVKLGTGGIGMARAKLGGPAALDFETWDGPQAKWVSTAVPANPQEASVLPAGACDGKGMSAGQAQLSYYPPTGEYVLTFICSTGVDTPRNAASAWFWSTTTDLESQNWSQPQQIYGTWNSWQNTNPNDATCNLYNGWYPTFMSLGQDPGVLSTNGYVFYMIGDLGCGQPQRKYASRAFTISTNGN